MKKISGFILPSLVSLFVAGLPMAAQAQEITLPRDPSPSAAVSQTIGISEITVKYSRPSVRGREIWGKLVPYGWYADSSYGNAHKAPWRSGANESSTISFTHAGSIEGKPVPAGKYGLFFIINADNSGEVVVSKTNDSWGSYWYDETQDLLRAPIKIRDTSGVDILSYSFTNVAPGRAELDLAWAGKIFPVQIALPETDIVLDNAAAQLRGVAGFSWQGYLAAARYALINKIADARAIGWADTALHNNVSFTTYSVKAGLMGLSGKTAEQEDLMKKAMNVATEVEINQYGYQLLAAPQVDKAIETFELNTKRFPKSPNAWDSLGEGYATKGEKGKAIASFKKSLALNPTAATRANSEKWLRTLGTN